MLRGVAEDLNDRNLALAVWAGLFCGGPLIAIIALAVKWSDRSSLARRHAVVALWMYAVIVVVYFPVTIWAFGFRGSQAVFWAVWVTAVTLTLIMTVAGVITALRAPIAASPTLGRPIDNRLPPA